MTRALVLASLLAATTAGAQPITRPTACGVNIAYAPTEVRIVVDAFVAQETTCNATLEVRIVPTDGGLYLFARDDHGRVRERVVPDAQAAAVLVASWMADDSKPPAPPPIAVFDHHLPPTTSTVDPFDKVPSKAEANGWLFGIGPTLAGAGAGARAELDVASWGVWSIGVAAALVDNEATVYTTAQQPLQSMDVIDATGLVYVTRRTDLGDWYLRPALGVGFTYTQMKTRMDDFDPYQPWSPGIEYQADGTVATVDAQLLLGRRLGDHWQLDAGPGVTVFADGPGILQRSPQRSLFAALRYRL